MIPKPKIAPAKFFHRVFTQKQGAANESLSAECFDGLTNQEPTASNDAVDSTDEAAALKLEISDLRIQLELCQERYVSKQEEFNTLAQEKSNLAAALKIERHKTTTLQRQLEEEKKLCCTERNKAKDAEKLILNQQKAFRRSSPAISLSSIEECRQEIDKLDYEKQILHGLLHEKADKIYNICVLYMRLKSSKDLMRTKIGRLSAEFEEVSTDLIEKLTESRDEINLIADTRYQTMKDSRNANMIRVVQKNGQLALENSTLRLEMSRLKQMVFDLENESTIVEINTTKREVKTIPSRNSFSTSSLRAHSHDNAAVRKSFPKYYSKYSTKISTKVPTDFTCRSEKQDSDGNRCLNNLHKKSIDDRRTAEFINNLPDPPRQYRRNITHRSDKSKHRDSEFVSNAFNVETHERKIRYAQKSNKKSVYSHKHHTDAVYESLSKESIMLQAASVTASQSDQSLKLDLKNIAPGGSEISKESLVEGRSVNCRGEACVTHRYSEESLFSVECNLPASKSAPEIMQSTKCRFTDEDSGSSSSDA